MDVSKPRKPGLSSAKRFSQRHASTLLTKHGRPLARLPHSNFSKKQSLPICVQQKQASAIADQANGQLRSEFKNWRVGRIWGSVQGREKIFKRAECPDGES